MAKQDNSKEVAELKKIIEKMDKKYSTLEKRVKQLEKELQEKSIDRRIKKESIHILGFTLVKSGKYYHAVRTVDGDQWRIYIGKNIEDLDKVKSKIMEWFDTNSWAKSTYDKIIAEHPENRKEKEIIH